MSRLTDHLAKLGDGTPADPLPPGRIQGDSINAEIWDHDDTPPGVDWRTGQDHRTEEEKTAWAALESRYGDDIPFAELQTFEAGRRGGAA